MRYPNCTAHPPVAANVRRATDCTGRLRRCILAVAGLLASLAGGFSDAEPAIAWPVDWVTGPDMAEGEVRPVAILSDPRNRLIIGGGFGGHVTFGKGEPNETLLENSGYGGPFLAVFQPDGRLAWAKAGETIGAWVRSFDVDTAGDIFATGGYFFGDFCFDAVCIGNGSDDGQYLARFDRNGRVLWMRDVDRGTVGVAEISHGRSLTLGIFDGSTVIGRGEPGETALTGKGFYLARHTVTGTIAGVSFARGAFDSGLSVETASGTSVVVGTFRGTATFAPGQPNAVVLRSAGAARDAFLAAYGKNGQFLWAKRWGDASEDSVKNLAVDRAGRIFVLSAAAEGGQPILSGIGKHGRLLFRKRLSGAHTVSSVACGGDGRVHVTGTFAGTATFGAGEPAAVTLEAVGIADIFVAHYSTAGNFGSVERIGGQDLDTWQSDSSVGVAVDAANRVAVTGYATPPIRFGYGTGVPEWTLGPLFVVRYGSGQRPHAADATAAD